MDELEYIYLWLCLSGLYTDKIIKLKNFFGNEWELRDASLQNLLNTGILTNSECHKLLETKKYDIIEKEYERLQSSNVRFVHIRSKLYPEKLRDIFDPPQVLFYKGELPKENEPLVSVVGARECTQYGRQVAYSLAKKLGNNGVGVVSGMARGIDGASHQGVLEGTGNTYAILGCGVDNCYPRENIELYSRIPDRGGVISEYVLGTKPLPLQFPMRNRIISGMSDAVIIVEAKEKSGSLITIDQALEQGREVFVVPGRLDDKLSKGCNNLIKMGAQIITDIEDVLDFLKQKYDLNKKNNMKLNILLARDEKMVYSCLDLHPKHLNEILNELDMSIQEIMDILMRLQMKGLIRESSKNNYIINV